MISLPFFLELEQKARVHQIILAGAKIASLIGNATLLGHTL